MKHVFFFRNVFFTLFAGVVFFLPQTLPAANRVDSLLLLLSKRGSDTAKVNLLHRIAAEYYNNDKEKNLKYITEALNLSRKINYEYGEAKAINSLGILVQKNGNYDSALALQSQSLLIYRKLRDTLGIAKLYSDIANCHWRKSDYVTAMDFQLKALKLYERINDMKGLAFSYNMIGVIHKNMKKDREALDYFFKSVEIKKKISDEKGLASTYQNIANVYQNRLNEDTAMMYYEKALTLHKKFNNLNSQSMVISGMGNMKFKLGKYQEAIHFYLRSVEVEKSFLDSNSLATSYINIGNAYTALENYKRAGQYIHDGLSILLKLGDREGVMSAYEMLAYLYQEQHNYEKALAYNQLYYQVRDSIMSVREKNSVAELQVQYEVEKKDLQLARSAAELETKRKEAALKNTIIVSIAGLVLFLALVAYLFYQKKRAEQQTIFDKEVARQKDIRTKTIIETEEKERVRIARDLHDGIGQLLSAAKLNLSSLSDTILLNEPGQKIAFKNATDLLDESVKELRAVSHNMMPNVLLKLGLATAVKEFITKIQTMPDLKVNLEIIGMNERMEPEKESVLYRVIQEVVSNIIKHANASELILQLIRYDKEFTITIEDNGVGFDTSKINASGGIGLKNIISRVEFINGTVNFDSTPGHGTTVVIEVPMV